jgi:hypothetical protein
MKLREVEDVIGEYTGNARTVLEYGLIVSRMMDAAKKPGFDRTSWAPLAELVDVGNFERVGNFKETMRWDDYLDFLTPWAMSSEWKCSFKRVTERENTVFLELEEHAKTGDFSNVVNSISVYEFNDAGKIHHIDVYLQMEPLPAEIQTAS